MRGDLKIRIETSPRFKSRKFKIVETNILGASLPYIIVLLGVKRLSDLLKYQNHTKGFFNKWSSFIEQSRVEQSSKPF